MDRLLGFVAIVCGGCFDPVPAAGSPCPTGVCPSGLECSPASQTCEREAVDAAVDVMIDAAILRDAAPGCYGVGLVSVCPMPMPTSPLVVNAAIDTDTSPLCMSYTGTTPGKLCVVAGTTVTVNGTVTAKGTRPLVLVATDLLVINGMLDASSRRDPVVIGANSQPAACLVTNAVGDRGGPGGSLGGRGGTGGAGETNGSQLSAPKLASLTELRGGCAGGTGSRGVGGKGGGALYLIAGTTITIDGTVNASGAGGGAGVDANESGGGGGSGGMIGIDAPTIQLGALGRVLANGGGGGASDTDSDPGEDPMLPNVAARGGSEHDGGGANGGNGAAGITPDGRNGNNGDDGGGGGGGGAGIIKVFPLRSIGVAVSPPPT